MSSIEKVITILVDKEFDVRRTKVGYKVGGFYKSDFMTIYSHASDELTFSAVDRYSCVSELRDFDDLVRLNHQWWIRSRNRSDAWSEPDLRWGKEFIRLGLARKKVVEVWE